MTPTAGERWAVYVNRKVLGFFKKNRDVLNEVPSWRSLKSSYAKVIKAPKAELLTDDEVSRLLMEFKLLEDSVRDSLLGKRFKANAISDGRARPSPSVQPLMIII